jgi:hypothetical protein
MILELPALLAGLLPGIFPDGRAVSIGEVQTSRPLYLVFLEGQSFPICIVECGPECELRPLHLTMLDVHAVLPDLVPRPIACAHWRGGLWVRVNSGLPGVPWFSLPRTVHTLGDWLRLRTRALATLRQFQAAVRDNPKWGRSLDLGDELRQQLEVSKLHGFGLSGAVSAGVAESARRLDMLGSRPCYWQHGDFGLNNLLVSHDRLGLIDFEEFGSTAVPLHDELSLAFSLHSFTTDIAGAPPLHAQIRECSRQALETYGATNAPMVTGLLFHHLLFRLNQCAGRARRRPMADVLRSRLETLALAPESFVRSAD